MNTLQKQILNALMGDTNESLSIFASWGADPATLRATPLGVSFEVNGLFYSVADITHQCGRVEKNAFLYTDPAQCLRACLS